MKTFAFESYGVSVTLESSRKELLDEAVTIVRASLLGRVTERQSSSDDHLITLRYRGNKIWMIFDGEDFGVSSTEIGWRNYFDTRIRLLIGEHASGFIFLHAGAVAWKGRAILCPGDSFTGKSTLVAELVRRGADYLSDEYAILDAHANVHAFPRHIALRPEGEPGSRYYLSPESLGARIPEHAVPPGFVLLAQHRPRARWSPVIMSPGQGVLEIIPHALPVRAKTALTLSVLKRLSERAIIIRSLRGSAKLTSQKIIDFIDKMVI